MTYHLLALHYMPYLRDIYIAQNMKGAYGIILLRQLFFLLSKMMINDELFNHTHYRQI